MSRPRRQIGDVPSLKQAGVLAFVREYIAERGYPPTVREIGAHMGVTSTNAVVDVLLALEEKGAIVRRAGAARAIQIVDEPLDIDAAVRRAVYALARIVSVLPADGPLLAEARRALAAPEIARFRTR